MLLFYLSLIEDEDDKTKFEKLYNKFKAPMVNYATKIMGNDADSEDIVHESFMRILNHMNGIDDIDCHKTNAFLVIIVRNRCIDYLRAQEKYPQISYNEEFDLYYRPYKKIQYNLEEIELYALVDKIKKLPEIYRDVVILKFHHGYNDREIADMLGVAYVTVRKRIERARELLGYSLKEWRK